jgi:16S rRNA (cytosine1402-N4)-methyltransferase
MTPFVHTTVLQLEVAALLAHAPGRRVLDCTLGGAGHAQAMLDREASVIGLDQDPAALTAARARLAPYGDRFVAVHANFRHARQVLDTLGVAQVDGALVDLGVSSPQLDVAERGFSFTDAGPLDMRMDPTSGEPLSEMLAHVGGKDLAQVIRKYGEEDFAGPIARAIKQALADDALRTTVDLRNTIVSALPGFRRAGGKNPATQTFQALRIWVNDELGALDAWLDSLPGLLAVGGRACVIAFHSLEDRPVKRRFADLSRGCVCPPDLPVCGCGRTAGWRLLTRKAVVASKEEVAANPRARSARLRCIERVAA